MRIVAQSVDLIVQELRQSDKGQHFAPCRLAPSSTGPAYRVLLGKSTGFDGVLAHNKDVSTLDEVEELLARQHGAIAVRQVPHRRGMIAGMARRGELVRVHPGIHVAAARANDPAARGQAALLWQPRGVLTGRAAAALTFWPECPVQEVDLLVGQWVRRENGVHVWRVSRGQHPDRCVRLGLDMTTPAWTAVWLARWDDGEAIEQALRRGWMNVPQMQQALAGMHGTLGQATRRMVVENSTEQPWSAAERKLHRLLRDAGVTGWHGNWPVTLGGRTWPIDVAFPEQRVAIEVDGFAFHTDRATFDWDHEKQARLQEAGWVVLRITWTMLVDDPEGVLRRIRALLLPRV